jgi:hypothetical protein
MSFVAPNRLCTPWFVGRKTAVRLHGLVWPEASCNPAWMPPFATGCRSTEPIRTGE